MGFSENINIGILAHVDAGKTTLAEALLYTCGQIRNVGRVDHKDAFLDNYSLERDRGITIFSKEARLQWKDRAFTLLDTPGHVDFGAEMERTLKVADVAILVVSGTDGVQAHTETLWRLLKRYGIPTFIFVNKMDRQEADKDALLSDIQAKLDMACVEFPRDEEFAGSGRDIMENIASCEEALMEEFLGTGKLAAESIVECVGERRIFPCFFGSALKLEGIEALLTGLVRYTPRRQYGDEFAAKVYKISRDTEGNRLTHLKVTGGVLKAKQVIERRDSAPGVTENRREKADQLRIYHGGKYRCVDEVHAGEICAVTGLKDTYAGEALGAEERDDGWALEPVMSYALLLPEDCDLTVMLEKLRILEEEIPELHILWNEKYREIHMQVMGEVQIEVLKSVIKDRFGIEVSFGDGSIVYKETIQTPVIGIGHYEPLRHYAEVHLLLEPAERGSGLQFASLVSEDDLDRNWQRLIMTHLEEKVHTGVLTNSEITDMRILLTAGRAHEKHTEGGDFRQATYRAIRQGLMKAKSILLEPVYDFTLEVPPECVGRAMTDIRRMCGTLEGPFMEGGSSILTGWVPAAAAQGYQAQVHAYSKGRGRLELRMRGYEVCHNTEEVLAEKNYDPESDTENPSYSVFCAHGAGYAVDWREVDGHAHLEDRLSPEVLEGMTGQQDIRDGDMSDLGKRKGTDTGQDRYDYITQEEIEEIFARTYRKNQPEGKRPWYQKKARVKDRKYDRFGQKGRGGKEPTEYRYDPPEKKEEYLLVDGYNIIFAWEELKALSEMNLDSAREKLIDIMCNYQGYLGAKLILVFDAYKVKNHPGSVEKRHNIYLVYTREAQTADQYIEETVHEIGKKYDVTVATSDGLEQLIIWGEGAKRMSARELKLAVEEASDRMRQEYLEKEERLGNRVVTNEDDKRSTP